MKQKKQWITKSLKCIKYDLHEGLLRMYLFYLTGAASIFAFALDAWRKLHYEVENPGVMELSIKIFEGMPVFEYIQGGPRLEIPMTYLVFALLACIPAAYYARREWKQRGNIFLTRYQSKGIWWLSKCILCIVQVTIFYAMAFFIIWIMAGIHGNWGFEIREEISMSCQGMLQTVESWKIFLFAYVLGICTMTAITQMITSMQMLVSPVVAYAAAVGIFIAASCIDKMYILGNNMMLLRTKIFNEGGVGMNEIFQAALIFWIVFVFFGWIIIKKKDIL